MRKPVRNINLVQLILLLVLLVSSAVLATYAFPYFQASSSHTKAKSTETVQSEDMVLVLSSSKLSYLPGETAGFYIDISNTHKFPISKIDFTLKVRAVSLFDLNVFSMEGSSNRTFMPGRFERMQTLPKDAVEVRLPKIIPPGFYDLELSAKSPDSEIPTEATITIYIEPSMPLVLVFVMVMLFSAISYVLTVSGSHVSMDRLPRNPVARKVLSLAFSASVLSKKADTAFREVYLRFSVGQKFVFYATVTLAALPLPMILGFENSANDLAVLAYLSLAIGVINLLWETSRHSSTKMKFPPKTRLMLCLFMLGLLTYFSNRLLGSLVVGFTLYLVARELLANVSNISRIS
jgi:hypothetical protein